MKNNGSSVKAPRKSAVAQPKESPVQALFRTGPPPPWSLLAKNNPYVEADINVVCEWNGHEGSWEQLLVNDKNGAFYIHASRDAENAPPSQICTSTALHWYACKRQLECEYGELSWPNLGELLIRAVDELEYLEKCVGKRGAE